MTTPQNVAHFSRGVGENLLAATFTIYPGCRYPLLLPLSLSPLLRLPTKLVIFLVAATSKRKLKATAAWVQQTECERQQRRS